MAKESIEEIINSCLKQKKDFVVNGGAGSGKTYTLINTINNIVKENMNANIACITYTKVAAGEIKKRLNLSNKQEIFVSTIHEFLWENIKNFQISLKKSLIELIDLNKKDSTIGIKPSSDFDVNLLENVEKIEYRDYRILSEGVITHNDVIVLSNYMFDRYNKLCDIVNDKYDYILIDEYQDSFPKVIEIFLKYLRKNKTKNCTIGMFGDPTQQIYATGIGNINYDNIEFIDKDDNWRSGKAVINLINKLRLDDIKQIPKGENALLECKVKFIYSSSKKVSDLKLDMNYSYIDFKNNYKELYLTHNLIGKESNCNSIFSLFKEKDRLLGENRDEFISHLEKIEQIRINFRNKRHDLILEQLHISLNTISEKNQLVEKLKKLDDISGKNILEVIDLSNELGLVLKDDKYNDHILDNQELYDSLMQIEYNEFVNCYNYINNKSPYSTQHGVKGEEYENVMVILDNGKWSLYDYDSVLKGDSDNSKYERSLKLFYVSCSRAIKNLNVYYYNPTDEIINGAINLCGEENVINLDVVNGGN